MSTQVKHTALWLALIAAYWVVFAGVPGSGGGARPVEPLTGRARVLEGAIAERRFSEALPIAIEIQRTAPDDPLVYLWLASIHHGLSQPADEAAAWERFLTVATARDAACPALPEAYEHAGNVVEALRAFERCVEFDRREPERHIDLALALERAGRPGDAQLVWDRLTGQQPPNPEIVSRIARFRDHDKEAP